MNLIEILIIAIGLSMDALSVSICLGLQSAEMKGFKKYFIPAVYFGFFQALMPVIGYLAGVKFQAMISDFDHWIAFILLVLIGGNMVKESFSDKEQDCSSEADFSSKKMLALAVATSIDALAIGVTFAFLKADIITSSLLIGITTFLLSMAGVQIGTIFGVKYKSGAEILGGVVLILLGFKILIEHLFF